MKKSLVVFSLVLILSVGFVSASIIGDWLGDLFGNNEEAKGDGELYSGPDENSCSRCPDFNSDGIINGNDYNLLAKCVYDNFNCATEYDINNDGEYLVSDISCFNKDWGKDSSKVGVCNDFYDNYYCNVKPNIKGDMNADDHVNEEDYHIFNWIWAGDYFFDNNNKKVICVDINGNGELDDFDLLDMIDIVSNCPNPNSNGFGNCVYEEPFNCVPSLSCNDYKGKCGLNYNDGCNNILDCSDNCGVGESCTDNLCIEVGPIVTCTDSDGGKKVFIAGKVDIGNDILLEDYCLSETILIERYCTESLIQSKININCPYGFGCKEGACVEVQITKCDGGICTIENEPEIKYYCDGESDLKGDMNADNIVNEEDFQILEKLWKSDYTFDNENRKIDCADINGNGDLDDFDLLDMLNLLPVDEPEIKYYCDGKSDLKGDMNADNIVNEEDFRILEKLWKSDFTFDNENKKIDCVDINGNGDLDDFDLLDMINFLSDDDDDDDGDDAGDGSDDFGYICSKESDLNGDMNADNIVNEEDFRILEKLWKSDFTFDNENKKIDCVDINGNGDLDDFDLLDMIELIPGDEPDNPIPEIIDKEGVVCSYNLLTYHSDDDGLYYKEMDLTKYDANTIIKINGLDLNRNNLVYVDNRNGNEDVYFLNTKTGEEIRITNNNADQRNPKIDGDIIVYEDYRFGSTNPKIFMYDLITGLETQITIHDKAAILPSISGNIIVWNDFRNADLGNGINDRDVYMYNLNTNEEILITTEKTSNLGFVTNDYIVYSAYDSSIVKIDPFKHRPYFYSYNLKNGVRKKLLQTTFNNYGGFIVSDNQLVWTTYVPVLNMEKINILDLDSLKISTINNRDRSVRDQILISNNMLLWKEQDPSKYIYSLYTFDLINKKIKKLKTDISFRDSFDLDGGNIAHVYKTGPISNIKLISKVNPPVIGRYDISNLERDINKLDSVNVVGEIPKELDGSFDNIKNHYLLDSTYVNNYLSYWSQISHIVYLDNVENLGKVGSDYASLINAPLIIKNTVLDKPEVFSGKYVICIGVDDSKCDESHYLNWIDPSQNAEINIELDKSLVTNFKFDLNSKNSLGGNYGNTHGNPELVKGVINKAYKLDGKNDYIEANEIVPSAVDSDYTMGIWVKSDSNLKKQYFMAFNTNLGGNRVLIGHQANSDYLSVYDGGWKTSQDQNNNIKIIDGKWHYVNYVYNKIDSSVALYVDGKNILNYISTNPIKSSDLFTIGMEYDFFVKSNHFDGVVDEFRFWNKALTKEEIDFEKSKGNFIPISKTNNKKDMTKYNDKEGFFIFDKNWRDLYSLIPLTKWTQQKNEADVICKTIEDDEYYFGGMWGLPFDIYVNPITGSKSCPAGYTDKLIYGQHNIDNELHVCYGVPGEVDKVAEFGGMWGLPFDIYVNPITGSKSCPAGYSDVTVLGQSDIDNELHVCYK